MRYLIIIYANICIDRFAFIKIYLVKTVIFHFPPCVLTEKCFLFLYDDTFSSFIAFKPYVILLANSVYRNFSVFFLIFKNGIGIESVLTIT